MYRLMIIDTNRKNCEALRGMINSDYKLLFCTEPAGAITQIAASKPSLILIHINLGTSVGIDLCRKVRADTKTSRIPIIMYSDKYVYLEEVQSFYVGAVDYLALPFSVESLKARINTQMSLNNQQFLFETQLKERTREIEQNQIVALAMLANAGHFNDADSGVHIWRMAAYTGALARALGWNNTDAHRLALGASLHDTGKIGIPTSVMNKADKLSAEEFAKMKDHSQIGFSILHHMEHPGPIFELGAQIAQNHHERWDGTGYPRGIKGTVIPISARIATVADVFDVLTMKRVYKQALSFEDAFALIAEESGTHFEPAIVKVFLSIKSEIMNLYEKWNYIERNNLFYSNIEEILGDL